MVDDLGDLVVGVATCAGPAMSASVISAGSTVIFRARASAARSASGIESPGWSRASMRVVVEAQLLQPVAGVAEGVPGAVIPGRDVGDLGLELGAEASLGLRSDRSGRPRPCPPWGSWPAGGPTRGADPSRTSRPARTARACASDASGSRGDRLRQASRAASTWARRLQRSPVGRPGTDRRRRGASAGSGATRLRIVLYFSGVGVR